MKSFSQVAFYVLGVAGSLGAQVQTTTVATPSAEVTTTTQVNPNAAVNVGAEAGRQVLGQPGYQYLNGTVSEVPPEYVVPPNPYAADYSYGESSVQYTNPVLPVKPYVPYSMLSPPQNAYPLVPYNTPEQNQVNQTFMQRYSQQDQDYIRSQFGYPQTIIDPNAGKPPLGKPIRMAEKPNPLAKGKGKKGEKESRFYSPPAPPKKVDVPTFFFPGMVVYTQRKWVGSDYLYYLPNNIGVVIEVIADKQITSEEGKVLLEESKLKKRVEDIFRQSGIVPQSYSVDGAAPLPFFHILIMMYHVESRVFASISGRLFEEVTPARLNLDQPVGTFQAITWEKNDLLIVSTPQAPVQLELMIDDIAKTFLTSYLYFVNMELDILSPDDLRNDDQ